MEAVVCAAAAVAAGGVALWHRRRRQQREADEEAVWLALPTREFRDLLLTSTFHGQSAKAARMVRAAANCGVARFGSAEATSQWLGQVACLAARVGNETVLRSALASGSGVGYLDVHSGESALMIAAKNGQYRCMALLLDHLADVNLTTARGGSALIWTAINGRAECAALLLAHGADPNLRGADGRTPMHFAAKNGHRVALHVLCLHGARLDLGDIGGNVPLHVAAAHGSARCVEFLAQRSLETLHRRNGVGLEPFDVAVLAGQKEAASWLLRMDRRRMVARLFHVLRHEASYTRRVERGAVHVLPLPSARMAVRMWDMGISPAAVPTNVEAVVLHLLPLLSAAHAKRVLSVLCARFASQCHILLQLSSRRASPRPSSSASSPSLSSSSSVPLSAERKSLVHSVLPLTMAEIAPMVRNAVRVRGSSLITVLRSARQAGWVTAGDISRALRVVEPVWARLDERLADLQQGHSASLEPPSGALDLVVLVDVMHTFLRHRMLHLGELFAAETDDPRAQFLRFVHTHLSLVRRVCLSESARSEEWTDFFLEQCATLGPSSASWASLAQCVPLERKRQWVLRRVRAEALELLPRPPDTALLLVDRSSGVTTGSCSTVLQSPPSALLGHLEVAFEREAAVGAGVLREWFHTAAAELMDVRFGLWEETGAERRSLRPHPGALLAQEAALPLLEYAGRLVALAVAHEQPLPLRLGRCLMRRLQGLEPTVDDWRVDEPVLHRNAVEWVLNNSVEGLGWTFSHAWHVYDRWIEVELVPGGAAIEVTEENKRLYVERWLDAQMRGQNSAEECAAFAKGFHAIVPAALARVFSLEELDLLIGGPECIDVDDWVAYLEPGFGLSRETPLFVWFLELLHEWPQDSLARLLLFSTGAARAPLGGFGALRGVDGPQRFAVMRAESDDPRALPTASTCFNLLKLPNYPSKDVLEDRLLTAVSLGCTGFSFH